MKYSSHHASTTADTDIGILSNNIMTTQATLNGSLDGVKVLQWPKGKHCPWNGFEVCESAAKGGDSEALE